MATRRFDEHIEQLLERFLKDPHYFTSRERQDIFALVTRLKQLSQDLDQKDN